MHSEKLHNIFFSRPVIELRSMGWARHVARVGENRNAFTGHWRESLKGNKHM